MTGWKKPLNARRYFPVVENDQKEAAKTSQQSEGDRRSDVTQKGNFQYLNHYPALGDNEERSPVVIVEK
ncbi:hypothetical protein FM036_46615 [Nostoc sp. HG1]|nr:hypothetical protein [Nostoc sp. HG1]